MSFVLIADDDDAFAKIATDLLLEQGYEVDRAKDASQFSAMIDKRLPHLAVVDMQMPGGGGPAAVKAIRSRSPHRPVPVMVCSGMPAAQLQTWFGADPAVTILQKPIDWEKFLLEAARLLAGV